MKTDWFDMPLSNVHVMLKKIKIRKQINGDRTWYHRLISQIFTSKK